MFFRTFSWLRRGGAAEDRLRRLRRVLDQTGIEYSQDNPESALYGLPLCGPPSGRGRQALQQLVFPLNFSGRIALLDGGFHPSRNVRELDASDLGSLVRYAPEALVCPLDVALSLADLKLRGLFDLPSLNTALVVLTRLDDSLLADHHRDLLWQAFRVPVFEQVRGWDTTVIARECELHDGLHVAESSVIPQLYEDELVVTHLTTLEGPLVRVRTGLAAEIVAGHCDCGSEAPRLRSLMPIADRAAVR